MTGAVLRRATWRDIPELTALDAQLFDHDAWAEQTWWQEFAERPRRDYVVAVNSGGGESEGEHIVGYAGLDAGGSAADVMTVAVVVTARGAGLGARLVNHLVETAQHRGAEALLLEVRADNHPALHLYEKLGFQRLSVRRRYYQPGDIDAVIMRKLLTSAQEAS